MWGIEFSMESEGRIEDRRDPRSNQRTKNTQAQMTDRPSVRKDGLRRDEPRWRGVSIGLHCHPLGLADKAFVLDLEKVKW
jgi:hypothetical protein